VTEVIIKTEALSKNFILPGETVEAVKHVSVTIHEEEFVAIMGPSGSGKTTFLDVISCLESITDGKLFIAGQELTFTREKDLPRFRRDNFGFVFQDFFLVPTLTAIENIELPLLFARKKINNDVVMQILNKVGLWDRQDHLPKELSGGEMQRVAIARALVVSPRILIADEPTGNLDVQTAQGIFDLFKKINAEEKITIVVATHNPKLGAQADRIIRFVNGERI